MVRSIFPANKANIGLVYSLLPYEYVTHPLFLSFFRPHFATDEFLHMQLKKVPSPLNCEVLMEHRMSSRFWWKLGSHHSESCSSERGWRLISCAVLESSTHMVQAGLIWNLMNRYFDTLSHMHAGLGMMRGIWRTWSTHTRKKSGQNLTPIPYRKI